MISVEENFYRQFDRTLCQLIAGSVTIATGRISPEAFKRALVTSLIGRAFDVQVTGSTAQEAARVLGEHLRAAESHETFGPQAGEA